MKLYRRYSERKPIPLRKNLSGNVDSRERGSGRGVEIIKRGMARETGDPNRVAQVVGIGVGIDKNFHENATPRFEDSCGLRRGYLVIGIKTFFTR
mmetsp:Transcript_10276/g.30104  ORF Transcript_10276/g.30104 Transcript_10276/m.30104 type:complete len:95 (+) Transcript_10276:532-816(+)